MVMLAAERLARKGKRIESRRPFWAFPFTVPCGLIAHRPMLIAPWPCRACTYLNPTSATKRCEVCASFRNQQEAERAAADSEIRQRHQLLQRLHDEQERSSRISLVHFPSDPDGDIDMAAVSASGSWLCPACTNMNRRNSVKCSACFTTRASSDAIAAKAAAAATSSPVDAAAGRASKRRKGPAATAVAIDDDDDDDGTTAGASASASSVSASAVPSSAPRPARSTGDSAPHIHTHMQLNTSIR